MKKILLMLGVFSTIILPITVVISCSSTSKNETPINNNIDGINSNPTNENIPTLHTGTKANNTIGEDLSRPFNDIADTQDENTIYEILPETKIYMGEYHLTSDIFNVKNFNDELSGVDLKQVQTIDFTIGNITHALNQSQMISVPIDGVGWSSGGIEISNDNTINIKATMYEPGIFKLEKDNKFKSDTVESLMEFNELDITKVVVSKKRFNNYWSSKVPTKITPIQFKWNADECHSIEDIILQMDSQLHFSFQKKLSKMTPLNFANYIVNLAINNGGGDWDFKVNYNGESDDVIVKPAPVLNDFIRALDGDANPDNKTDYSYHAVSNKTPIGLKGNICDLPLANLNISSFMSMLSTYDEIFAEVDMTIIFKLMSNFPSGVINIFPKFVELFSNMGKQFIKSPVAQKWASNQDEITQEKFQHADVSIIKSILSSGK